MALKHKNNKNTGYKKPHGYMADIFESSSEPKEGHRIDRPKSIADVEDYTCRIVESVIGDRINPKALIKLLIKSLSDAIKNTQLSVLQHQLLSMPIQWWASSDFRTASTDGKVLIFNIEFAHFLYKMGEQFLNKKKRELEVIKQKNEELGTNVYFNVIRQREKELKYMIYVPFWFVMVHEVYHKIYRHIPAGDKYKTDVLMKQNFTVTHNMLNIAGDAEINRDIENDFPIFKSLINMIGGIKATGFTGLQQMYGKRHVYDTEDSFAIANEVFVKDRRHDSDINDKPLQPNNPPKDGSRKYFTKEFYKVYATIMEWYKSGKIDPSQIGMIHYNDLVSLSYSDIIPEIAVSDLDGETNESVSSKYIKALNEAKGINYKGIKPYGSQTAMINDADAKIVNSATIHALYDILDELGLIDYTPRPEDKPNGPQQPGQGGQPGQNGGEPGGDDTEPGNGGEGGGTGGQPGGRPGQDGQNGGDGTEGYPPPSGQNGRQGGGKQSRNGKDSNGGQQGGGQPGQDGQGGSGGQNGGQDGQSGGTGGGQQGGKQGGNEPQNSGGSGAGQNDPDDMNTDGSENGTGGGQNGQNGEPNDMNTDGSENGTGNDGSDTDGKNGGQGGNQNGQNDNPDDMNTDGSENNGDGADEDGDEQTDGTDGTNGEYDDDGFEVDVNSPDYKSGEARAIEKLREECNRTGKDFNDIIKRIYGY